MAKKKSRSTKPVAKKRVPKAKSTRRSPQAPKRATPRRAKAKRAAPAVSVQQQSPPPPKVGSFVWHELMTPDVARAKSFYSSVFGWKLKDEEMMPGFIYTTAANKGETIGGMMAIAPEQGDIKPHWMVYIAVKNVDAIAEQTEAMGGEIVVPPHDIPVGRWALLKDPTGAAFAVYKRSSR